MLRLKSICDTLDAPNSRAILITPKFRVLYEGLTKNIPSKYYLYYVIEYRPMTSKAKSYKFMIVEAM